MAKRNRASSVTNFLKVNTHSASSLSFYFKYMHLIYGFDLRSKLSDFKMLVTTRPDSIWWYTRSLKSCDFFLLAVPIIVWAKYKCWIYVYLEKVFDYSSASNDSKLKFIAYVYMCGERERERILVALLLQLLMKLWQILL